MDSNNKNKKNNNSNNNTNTNDMVIKYKTITSDIKTLEKATNKKEIKNYILKNY